MVLSTTEEEEQGEDDDNENDNGDEFEKYWHGDDDYDQATVAIEVANQCKGLPILVVTVAKALKCKNLHSWKDVLRNLKWCGGNELEKAYSGIEWSYNQLEGAQVKSLFLIFGMDVGRYYHLNYTLKCTLGLGLSLFEGMNTMEEADDRLRSLVDKLKDYCLLLDTNEDGIVTMHDLTRDVARKIASIERHFLSKGYGDEFKEWPTKEVLEKCTMISLDKINIPNLPEELGSPELQLFGLYSKDKTLEIPPHFFKEMKQLKVLDLTNLCIPSLPPSVQSLSMIHPNVISSLTSLEELNMYNNFNKWETEEASNNISEGSNASLSELKHLSNLTTLGINIKDASQLPFNFFSDKLKHFKIFIGDVWDWDAKYATSKTLKLKLSQRNQCDQGLETILNRCEDFSLDVFEGITNIVYDQLVMDGFQRLKKLHVQNNPEISHIELSLLNLISLESVCCGQLGVDSFKKLKIIKVENCPKLKNLFSRYMLVHELLELEKIEVADCKSMKEIVEGKEQLVGEVNDPIKFHGLRSLTLRSVPELISFSSNHSPLVASTSRNPTQLFNDKANQ
ncbi:hypothetical protein FNV43_RR08847 [Rhamnella rubrinervis]|uniref:Disease resistance protein At4g27190-like leucine-rich repeats domain-containing protein n=1 Tax=Rhamnella rubrinervis TaxID=2594499 RepID=A0A8K0H9B8_9ROSA|nr:hypothetical protein FNV43_RR08847 [Rhamnella rubrinervis]